MSQSQSETTLDGCFLCNSLLTKEQGTALNRYIQRKMIQPTDEDKVEMGAILRLARIANSAVHILYHVPSRIIEAAENDPGSLVAVIEKQCEEAMNFLRVNLNLDNEETEETTEPTNQELN